MPKQPQGEYSKSLPLGKDVLAAYDALLDPCFVFDKDNQLCFLNSAAECLFEHQKEVLKHPASAFLAYLLGTTGKTLEHQLKKEPGPVTIECYSSTRARWLQVRACCPPEGGLALCVVDITVRHNAEEDLKQSQQEVRQLQKMDILGRLLGGVVHDLNNLLTIILGYIGTLSRHFAGNPPTDLKEMLTAAQRSAELVRHLLIFSRKEINAPLSVSLKRELENLLPIMRRLIPENIKFEISSDEHSADIRISPAQLGQVLMNLIVNARDAMPKGGTLLIDTRTIELDETSLHECPDLLTGRYVVLNVSDTGMGMSAEVKARLFEPFFTTKKGEGTGLGLSTTRDIVKQSSGYIVFESHENFGTSFKIFWPYTPSVPLEEKPAELLDDAPCAGRVLVTEDNAEVRKVIVRILQDQGFEPQEAADAESALAIAKQDCPDILLTDLVLTGIGGTELAELLREEHPNLPVLYMSGYASQMVLPKGALRNIYPLLQKPFTKDALCQRLRQLLKASKTST